MTNDFSLSTSRLVWDASTGRYKPPTPVAERVKGYFIKGPIPLPWILCAAALPGKALQVALALWYMKGLCKSPTFPFKRSKAKEFSVSADATYDALTRLENAGLISVVRHCGRSPVVTIIDLDQPVQSGVLTNYSTTVGRSLH